MKTNLLSSTTYLYCLKEENGETPAETYHTIGQSWQKAYQALLYQGNKGYLKCVRHNSLPQPFRERLHRENSGSQKLKP